MGDLTMNSNFNETEIINIPTEAIPAEISVQFDKLVKLEDTVRESIKKASAAKGKADSAQVKVGLFNKKKAISLLQDALKGSSDAVMSLVDAQKLSFEYQKELTKIMKYLFGLGVSNIAANRMVVRQLKLKLEDASEEEMSDLAKQEVENVILQLKAQEDVMRKQEFLTGKVKEQTEKVKEHDTLIAENTKEIAEQNKEISEQAEKDKELDALIAENKQKIAKQNKEISEQAEKDKELDALIAENKQKIAKQNKEISEQAEKDKELDALIAENKQKIAKQDKEISEQAEKDKELGALIAENKQKNTEQDKMISELINTIKNHDKLIKKQTSEIKNLNEEIRILNSMLNRSTWKRRKNRIIIY
jgi:hypothetical protein